ncbi:MAG TPA: single-stranded DNA-binding protein [Saprospiraceae bacterium]|nr:single-stranded DNA-binding protein [Saprospiraceae bacterium]HMQ84174.1 single-stranded DNA-binding protein [Saprospiraceae bacterium]
MNNIKNSILLIGHLGTDPKITEFSNGNKVASISLATNEIYKNNKGEKVKETQWHRCVAWGKLADLVGNLCHKGKEVAIRGKLVYKSYEDKQGNRQYSPEIVISEFALLSKEASVQAS